MVQASSSLLWPRSSRKNGAGHGTADRQTGDSEQLHAGSLRSGLAASLNSNPTEEVHVMNIDTRTNDAFPDSPMADIKQKGESGWDHACKQSLLDYMTS